MKGLQSYQSSNFENDLTPNELNFELTGLSGARPGGRLFLRPPTLKASKLEALYSTDPIFTKLKDLKLLKSVPKIKRLAAF